MNSIIYCFLDLLLSSYYKNSERIIHFEYLDRLEPENLLKDTITIGSRLVIVLFNRFYCVLFLYMVQLEHKCNFTYYFPIILYKDMAPNNYLHR